MKKLIAAGSLLLAATIAPVSFAQQGNFYVGGELGVSQRDDIDDEVLIGINGGYQFNPNFRLELGIRSLMNESNDSGNRYSYYTEDFSVTSYQVSAVGLIPLNSKVRLFGRLGVALLYASYEEYSRDYYDYYYDYYYGSSYSESETKGVAFGGAGVEVDIHSRLSASFEYTYYPDFLGAETDTFAVGIKWSF